MISKMQIYLIDHNHNIYTVYNDFIINTNNNNNNLTNRQKINKTTLNTLHNNESRDQKMS